VSLTKEESLFCSRNSMKHFEFMPVLLALVGPLMMLPLI
jgi:hypothetical protein